jgi:phosphatidate phosphatase PAH1
MIVDLRASALVSVLITCLGCGSADSASEPPPGAGGSKGADADAGPAGGSSGADAAKPETGGTTEAGPDTAPDAADEPAVDAPGPDAAPGCVAYPACDAPPPDPGQARAWNHWSATLVVSSGSPNHRGRDQFYNPGDEQWILGKMAYGLTDQDLTDEEVDIYLLRDCGSTWEKLGTTFTTNEGAHATVEGVEDNGGRIYFPIPASKALGLGLHRVHMVVGGDLTTADLFIEVVAPGTPTFVSDLDGTLTPDDTEEWITLLTGTIADNVPDSAAALQALADRGYHPYYLTARPEFLTGRSREFLSYHGYPRGLLHTAVSTTGAIGAQAATVKTADLAFLVKRGIAPIWAFGNSDTDELAYHNTGVAPDHTIMYNFTSPAYGSRLIGAYSELLPDFAALPDLCP